MDTILGHLAPHFLAGAGNDLPTARHAAAHMLAAYNAETEEELRLAAEVVSFGFHALEALSQAAAADLSLNKKLRLRGSAVSLSRESHKSQRKLDQLQRARLTASSQPPAVQPDAQAPPPQPPSTPDKAGTEQALGLIEFAREALEASTKRRPSGLGVIAPAAPGGGTHDRKPEAQPSGTRASRSGGSDTSAPPDPANCDMIPIWRRIAAWLRAAVRRTKSAPPANIDTTGPDGIAERVAVCAATVANVIGSGLPEVVYENALAHELRKAGLAVNQQQVVAVYYDGVIVGDYTADLLVENMILVELKAVKTGTAFDTNQCTNYLKATGLPRSLLVNFGRPRMQISRLKGGA